MSRVIQTLSALVLTGLLVSGCVTATPYQPLDPGQKSLGGYGEQQLEANRYRLTFAGNSVTKRETVETYLLYRAAELTLAQGYESFSVVQRATDRKARTITEPDPFGMSGFGRGPGLYWHPYWRYSVTGLGWRSWDPFGRHPFWADQMETRTIEKFEASAEILLLRTPKVADDPASFDARQVVANLAPNVVKPAP